MGLFDNIKGGFAFNKMAKAYKEILDCLGIYDLNHDVRYIYKASWIYNNCVMESFEKWHWNMFAGIMIPDYPKYGRITLNEANLIVMGKIGTISNTLEQEEQSIINAILDGESMLEVESLISASLKEKLLP